MHRLLIFFAFAFLCGCASQPKKNVSQSFPAKGVTKIILRAAGADSAAVASNAPVDTVEVFGIPTGGAQGYHSPDPKWRETPPERWPFSFVVQRFGAVLVVSTKGEINYIHHHYVMSDVRLRVPPDVEVVREQRQLTGSGEADLKAP
jgi:hypothetical protein